MAPDSDAEQEAQRLKALAEAKYKNSNLKSALKHAKKAHRLCPNLKGISSMLTAFKILRVASRANAAPDWYNILQVEPFSHINSIKKQYRKLELILHPDKNPYLGCDEAFKLVGEGFRIFSDKIRKKEYDMKLRIRIQDERIDGLEGNGIVGETFWTACLRCRLLHKFERKYLGYNLVCPRCKKSFLAVEVDEGVGGESTEEEEVVVAAVRVSERLKRKMDSKEKIGSVRSVGLEGEKGSGETIRSSGLRRKASGENLKEKESGGDFRKEAGGSEWGVRRSRRRMSTVGKEAGGSEWGVRRSRRKMSSGENLTEKESVGDGDVGKEAGGSEWGVRKSRRRMSTVGEVLARSIARKVGDDETEERSKSKRVKVTEETMILAEMQLEIKQKAKQGRGQLNQKEKAKDLGEKEKESEIHEAKKNRVSKNEKQKASEKSRDFEIESQGPSKTSGTLGIMTRATKKRSVDLEAKTREGAKKNQNSQLTKQGTSRK
ncbi:hypothetical protein CRYUN_Cryun19dG0161700 [Craigia yunnanensis]